MSNDKPTTEKWTEIEHLTEWDEEYYDVYTAKKHGKWVMLKTLRLELKDDPKYQEMLEKEFDVRYDLAHPNIVMINDLEDVPGVGRCIITDDVYGPSLRKLIDEEKVTEHHINQLKVQLVSAISYIQANHVVHRPIKPETIIFTETGQNLKLIDVGFDQKSKLKPSLVSEDIYNYGMIVREALDKSGIQDPNLRSIANRCLDPNPRKRYLSVESLRLAVEGRSSAKVYILVIGFLVIMLAILALMIIYVK